VNIRALTSGPGKRGFSNRENPYEKKAVESLVGGKGTSPERKERGAYTKEAH